MNSEIEDNGPTVNQLWGAAWLLGLGGLGSIIRLATYAAGGVPVRVEFFVWVLVGVVAAVFSAVCALLAGIKSAEQRLARRLESSRT